jgi:hypothetical protein
VRSGVFSSTEFFPNASGPGDCGTFFWINPDNASGLWGPDFGNHGGGSHTASQFGAPGTAFTPVSQSMVGSGTTTNQYRLTTAVSLTDGNLVLDVTEVDNYIVGNNFYDTNVTVTNVSASQPFDGGHVSTPRTASCAARIPALVHSNQIRRRRGPLAPGR